MNGLGADGLYLEVSEHMLSVGNDRLLPRHFPSSWLSSVTQMGVSA